METKLAQPEEIGSRGAPADADITTLASGAGITLLGRVGGRGFDAISDIILARLLGPSTFGLYSIGMTVVRIVGTVGMLGLQNGVIRFGTRYWRQSESDLKSTLFYSIGISVTSGLILGIALFLLAPWLAVHVYAKPALTPVFRGFAIAFPLAIGLWVAAAASRITARMKYSVLAEDLAQPVVNLALLTLLAFFGLTLAGSISANVLSFGLAFGLALYYVQKLFLHAISSPRSSSFQVRELLYFSIPTGLAGTFTLLTGWLSRLFVGFFRPAAEAGIYQTATQISIIFVIILGAFNTVFSPMIADLYHKKELGRIEELYKITTKWGLYLILPLYLVICWAPRQFMAAIFGPAYALGAVPLVILATTQLVNVGTGAVGFLLTMTGHQNNWFKTSGITMLVCIVLNILLVPGLGMVGAALATALAVGGLYVAGLAQVKLILGLWPYDRRYLKGLFAAVVALASLFLVDWLITSAGTTLLVITYSLTSLAVFWITLLLLGLDSEDREFIRILSIRIRNLLHQDA